MAEDGYSPATRSRCASDIRAYRECGVKCVMFGFEVDRDSPNATLEQMQRFTENVRPLVGE